MRSRWFCSFHDREDRQAAQFFVAGESSISEGQHQVKAPVGFRNGAPPAARKLRARRRVKEFSFRPIANINPDLVSFSPPMTSYSALAGSRHHLLLGPERSVVHLSFRGAQFFRPKPYCQLVDLAGEAERHLIITAVYRPAGVDADIERSPPMPTGRLFGMGLVLTTWSTFKCRYRPCPGLARHISRRTPARAYPA